MTTYFKVAPQLRRSMPFSSFRLLSILFSKHLRTRVYIIRTDKVKLTARIAHSIPHIGIAVRTKEQWMYQGRSCDDFDLKKYAEETTMYVRIDRNVLLPNRRNFVLVFIATSSFASAARLRDRSAFHRYNAAEILFCPYDKIRVVQNVVRFVQFVSRVCECLEEDTRRTDGKKLIGRRQSNKVIIYALFFFYASFIKYCI